MKHMYIRVLFLALLVPSCTSVYGDKNSGKFYAGSVLGTLKDLDISSGKASASDVNHDEANKSVQKYLYADAAKAITGSLTKGWVRTTQASEKTARVGLKETGLTKRADIAADVEKTRIAAQPEPQF